MSDNDVSFVVVGVSDRMTLINAKQVFAAITVIYCHGKNNRRIVTARGRLFSEFLGRKNCAQFACCKPFRDFAAHGHCITTTCCGDTRLETVSKRSRHAPPCRPLVENVPDFVSRHTESSLSITRRDEDTKGCCLAPRLSSWLGVFVCQPVGPNLYAPE